jgi:hypothetical protein
MLNEHVMVVGSMSHDWLFSKVSGVVHHGGAGTTSAGLRAGIVVWIPLPVRHVSYVTHACLCISFRLFDIYMSVFW